MLEMREERKPEETLQNSEGKSVGNTKREGVNQYFFSIVIFSSQNIYIQNTR